jgi:hypothetical protein
MPLESKSFGRALRSRALVLGACAALAACETRTDVSATGNAPPRYAHVYLTVQSLWFNADAAAAPSDTTWKKFDLGSPVTIDVIGALNGALASLASQLNVPAGTYAQMRLVLVDPSARLQGSAVSAGAIFNDEVDFFDNTGIEHILPLQTANSAQGIGTALTITVTEPSNSTSTTSGTTAGAAFIGTSSTSSSTSTGTTSTGTTSTGMTLFGTTSTSTALTPLATGSTSTALTPVSALGTTTTTTGTTATTTGTSTTTGTTTGLIVGETVSTAVTIDAKDELAPVNLSNQLGFVLNPHVSAYDLSQVGHIAGQVNATALPVIVGTGRPPAEVSAETLSSDGSRHIVVASTPLRSDGSFVLYPLPNSSTSSSSSSGSTYGTGSTGSAPSTTQYDLVIHGPGIGTVIVKSVSLTSGAPTGAATVQLGTIALVQTASYNVNVASSGALPPPGATVGFFQTLQASGEVPYLIERLPVDPFAGNFVSDQPISSANLSFAVYDSSFTVNTNVPVEGRGTYQVALSAPLYADGPLGATVTPPAVGSGGTSTFTAAALSLPAGASAASVSGTVNVATPDKYDRGELVLTHDGAIIATAPLDSYLSHTQSSATFLDSLPGGGSGGTYASGLYDAEVWVWNSTAPTVTLNREPSANPIDVRSGSASGVILNIT